jgi:hypothetical protein
VPQDTLTRIRERYKDAADAMREQHARMREDMEFSNPACPKQWDDLAVTARKGRPCLTFDRTNQFIQQVVNDGRQNKPSINVLPADSQADPDVAQKLDGMVRHIEYVSRSGIATDTALEHAVRAGLGFFRVIPQVMRPETNEQEIRIVRVHDPLSVLMDPNSTEPDGSDAMHAFVETLMTHRAFKAVFPKGKLQSFDSETAGWFTDDFVRVCEYFEVVEDVENAVIVDLGGERMSFSEEEYWDAAKKTGVKAPVVGTFERTKRRVKWCKVSGADVLEETDFPSQFLPVIPVMGHELWIDGKRYLSGMVRQMMDSQRFHNYAISAAAEGVALQPKAPFMAAAEAIEGWEDEWRTANSGNPSYLPFNARDPESGEPLPVPSRAQPPVMSQGWAELLGYSSQAMESSVGMFKANLGQQGNETSGRAIRARQQEGDTATFHFIDNLSRSIEQLGRVVVDMIPRIYDTQRMARIVGENGEQDFVEVMPNMPNAAKKQGKKVIAINPNVGAYDVRVKTGPSYTTQRQETAEQLSQMLQAAPNLLPMLGDVWVKMQDWPDAEKIARRLQAMLPPEIKSLEDEEADIPPEAQQQIQMLQQQIQQLSQALENAAAEAESKEIEKEKAYADMLTNGYKAVTERMSVLAAANKPQPTAEGEQPQQASGINEQQLQALMLQTMRQALALPPAGQPPDEQPQPTEPPQGGFSLPEGM